ncbi:MAG: ATP-dependent Clp protease proteolytic subunit [Chlorobi bacterium]|nr:MAG: ATP-dependent Clp protease, proteolytic subunit ClpP [Chlorobi bacterium OLB7]MBK8910024.1 ATP-dependent Clp protease proteolytic subunit [Chlorobiota bacterium]MBX7217474.1 ATP-dependent Clp protease proteolytic subunit [Candidatus Kapabacteria bacterium]
MIVPTIRERTALGWEAWDPFSRLLKERIIMLDSPINDEVASIVIAQLIYLESEDPNKDIIMYVNSPGGSVSAGLAIYDTMQYIRPDISTICLGLAASMGQVLLCAGTPGKRMALPNSRILMHQPSGGSQGQTTEIEIYLKEMIRMREQLYKIISLHSNQDVDRIRRDADRDFWMSPQDAVEYGLIDRVLMSRKEISRDMPQIPSTSADQRITIEETSVKAEAEK